MECICRASGERFQITAEDLRYLEKLSPKIGGQVYPLPPPTLCPRERKRRRLAFRNERRLYRRKCDATGRQIIAAYSPDKPYKVYSHSAYFSDSWNGLDYGRSIDFSRPFLEQVAELALVVPHIQLVTSIDAEENNCRFVNFSGSSRNCYLTFDSDFNEDSFYSNVLKHSKNCGDCSYVTQCELCYECADCSNCYQLLFSQDCMNCSTSAFLNGCIGCADCFFCCNMMSKRYCIWNKQYSREEYERIIKETNLKSSTGLAALKSEFAGYVQKFPKKFCHVLKTENCTGDYIRNAKNCSECFNIGDGEDLRFCDSLYTAKDCMDVSSFGERIQCVYEGGTIGINAYNIWFGFECVTDCADLLYCMECRRTRNSFGCVSLRQNEYCILNKQYTKSEYEKLAAKLIAHMRETGEWGEYFPMRHSWFGYNETMAQEFAPLGKEQCAALGLAWCDYEQPVQAAEVISAAELPDTIAEASDRILEQAIACGITGKPFRIVEPELRFYRQLGIPLPRRCPDQRHFERMALRNPQQLWERLCTKTGTPIVSSYSPQRPEPVYCEEAYAEALA